MKLFILLLTSFFIQTSFSQSFKLGPELGMNLIKTGKSELEINFQPAWYSGVMSEYKINDWLSIKGGLTYNQKIKTYFTADTTVSPTLALIGLDSINGIDLSTYSTTQGRHSLNFIQMPIMATYTLNNFSFSLGGYVGYQFNSRTKETYIERTPFMSTIDISSIDPTGVFIANLLPPAQREEFTETANLSFINKFDYGIKTGVSFSYNDLSFNVNYLYGLKDYSSQFPSSVKLNHHYFQFSMIAYIFNTGSKNSYSRG